jgi:hypothetical protein
MFRWISITLLLILVSVPLASADYSADTRFKQACLTIVGFYDGPATG